jgi:hypothetical protein
MVAATVVLSAASTLITLSLEYMRRDRRKPAAAAETPPRAREPPAPTPETGTSRDPQQRPPDGRPRPVPGRQPSDGLTAPRQPPGKGAQCRGIVPHQIINAQAAWRIGYGSHGQPRPRRR